MHYPAPKPPNPLNPPFRLLPWKQVSFNKSLSPRPSHYWTKQPAGSLHLFMNDASQRVGTIHRYTTAPQQWQLSPTTGSGISSATTAVNSVADICEGPHVSLLSAKEFGNMTSRSSPLSCCLLLWHLPTSLNPEDAVTRSLIWSFQRKRATVWSH